MPPNGVTVGGFVANTNVDRSRATSVLESMVKVGRATTKYLNLKNERGQLRRMKVYIIKG